MIRTGMYAGSGHGVPTVRIGVLSDTHAYLDPVILAVFAGVTHIIHAGDIMDPAIVTRLGSVAPVTAVAGNRDAGPLAEVLPEKVVGTTAGVRFVVAHKPVQALERLALGDVPPPSAAGPLLVVWGHLHSPSAAWIDGTLYLNPGTASSPDEEDDDPTVAIVELVANRLAVTFIPLERRMSRSRRTNTKVTPARAAVPRKVLESASR
jgi:putative phosphoesterase